MKQLSVPNNYNATRYFDGKVNSVADAMQELMQAIMSDMLPADYFERMSKSNAPNLFSKGSVNEYYHIRTYELLDDCLKDMPNANAATLSAEFNRRAKTLDFPVELSPKSISPILQNSYAGRKGVKKTYKKKVERFVRLDEDGNPMMDNIIEKKRTMSVYSGSLAIKESYGYYDPKYRYGERD